MVDKQTVKVLTSVVTDEGWKVGMAVWGEHGYTPIEGIYPTEEAAKKVCKEYNERHGFNEKQAWMIVVKTMFPGCIYTLEEVLNAGRKAV